jgi:hypothetical protein
MPSTCDSGRRGGLLPLVSPAPARVLRSREDSDETFAYRVCEVREDHPLLIQRNPELPDVENL